uniref:Uncharacterized protein n=1 Tax=Tanacetum cinerariifolium TaxID=118510 RepID=A0A6L2JVK5_TANCI|nr:hypothetical protein [Tanacetum cinerariifolium]
MMAIVRKKTGDGEPDGGFRRIPTAYVVVRGDAGFDGGGEDDGGYAGGGSAGMRSIENARVCVCFVGV